MKLREIISKLYATYLTLGFWDTLRLGFILLPVFIAVCIVEVFRSIVNDEHTLLA
jgi:hypothetical protein